MDKPSDTLSFGKGDGGEARGKRQEARSGISPFPRGNTRGSMGGRGFKPPICSKYVTLSVVEGSSGR
jgi:hypothetical protein